MQRYADVFTAADSPVLDTSCAALFSLARKVHERGYKVAPTGEGADEAFGGYIWFKLMELVRLIDVGGLKLTPLLCLAIRNIISPKISFTELARVESLLEGQHDRYCSIIWSSRRSAVTSAQNRSMNSTIIRLTRSCRSTASVCAAGTP